MNHFTPFLPVEALLSTARISDDRSRDLETRLLEAIRLRRRAQRWAEAALLVSIGFAVAFGFALQV